MIILELRDTMGIISTYVLSQRTLCQRPLYSLRYSILGLLRVYLMQLTQADYFLRYVAQKMLI